MKVLPRFIFLETMMIGREISAYMYGSRDAKTDIRMTISNCLARFGDAVINSTRLISTPVKIRLFIGTSFLFTSEKNLGNRPWFAPARGPSDCRINQPEIEPKQAMILRIEATVPAVSPVSYTHLTLPTNI